MRPRWLLLSGIVVVALVVAGVTLSWRSAIPAVRPPPNSAFTAVEIARGRALAALGNCMTCHTTESGRSFAGGRAVLTPFGTVYATNITPDPVTGIGSWSLAAFARAMREGLARDGSHLYPAFPYDHFAQTSGTDIAALYAYLMTRDAVRARAPPNRLPFPFNIRALLAGWNFLYMHRKPFRSNPARSAEWNRGAYLAETLAHCGACHTPHNALGAEETNQPLAGGIQEGWYAPPLNAHSPALTDWTADELANYLTEGVEPHHGAAAGPMRLVTQELALAPRNDVRAIAVYIGSRMPHAPPLRQEIPATNKVAAAVFAGACSGCHDSTRWPPLSNSTTLAEASPRNTIHILLDGIPWHDGTREPYMPGFAANLSDSQIAEISNYLRVQFSRLAPWRDAARETGRIRKEPRAP